MNVNWQKVNRDEESIGIESIVYFVNRTNFTDYGKMLVTSMTINETARGRTIMSLVHTSRDNMASRTLDRKDYYFFTDKKQAQLYIVNEMDSQSDKIHEHISRW